MAQSTKAEWVLFWVIAALVMLGVFYAKARFIDAPSPTNATSDN